MQELLWCVENIELLLENRSEYPPLQGPLRVYGPPRSVEAALGLSVRYLCTYAALTRWDLLPIDFRDRVVKAFDQAVSRLRMTGNTPLSRKPRLPKENDINGTD